MSETSETSQPPALSPTTSSGFSLRWFVFGLLLTVYFLAPPREAMTWELDSSNYGSYAWMAETGKQFGTKVIAMTGPFGYLSYGTTYSGHLFDARFIGDFLLKATFVFLFLKLAAQARGLRRTSWLVVTIFFLPNVGDLFNDFAILVAGLWLMTERSAAARALRPDFASVAATGLLGFMGLMKGTNAFVAGATLGAVVLHDLLARRPARAGVLVALASITFLAGWITARQSLANLPAYFRGIWELASGYNAAMGLAPSTRDLASALFLLVGFALVFGFCAWAVRRDLPRLVIVALLAGFTFLKWKHGFVRADGHVFIFFNFCVLALPATWLALGPAIRSSRVTLSVLTNITFAVALAAASEFRIGRFASIVGDAGKNLARNFVYLTGPTRTEAQREQELTAHRIVADLPQIRAVVGEASIDFFGYEQGVLLLNRLNYQPRPMGGGAFNVYTRYLQERNDAFLRDASRRPAFQLVKLQTIDGRLPAADDPLTLLALLHLYTPLRAQRDYVLFEEVAGANAPTPRMLSRHTVRFGEPFALPAVSDDQLLLFEVDAPLTLAGKLRSLAIRAPQLELMLTTETNDAAKTFRLAPAMARVPVLLSPLVETTPDLLGLWGGEPGSRVQTLTLRHNGGFADAAQITFSTLPRPPAAPDARAAEIQTTLAHPLHNRAPTEKITDETGIKELYGEPIVLVHAPGHLTFPLRAGDQQVMFHYGMMPQSYEDGETDGVEFIVELTSNKETVVLFRRLLQPLLRAHDRGLQWARVFLPPGIAGGELRLRTATGPAGNGAWDQSYFSRIQIKSGPLDPRQFFGFDISAPVSDSAARDEIAVEGRPALSFQPPAALHFPVPADSTRVTVGAGIVAEAHLGENQTDGVAFTISLISPATAPQILLQRQLDPLVRYSDRGTQTFDLSLPSPLPAGASLEIRVGPGPKDDSRWDWSYLQTVQFR